MTDFPMKPRPSIMRLAHLMEAKLRENDGVKTDWMDPKVHLDELVEHFAEEVKEFKEELPITDAGGVLMILPNLDTAKAGREGADVANMVMMILEKVGALKAPETGKELRGRYIVEPNCEKCSGPIGKSSHTSADGRKYCSWRCAEA